MQTFVVTLCCPDRPGIVAAVSTFLVESGQNILEAQQFEDSQTKKFFMRVVFSSEHPVEFETLRTGFARVANRLSMEWQMRDRSAARRVVLMVSKSDHCLVDILYRWRNGELDMIPTAIVSNHPRETHKSYDLAGIPFHYLPVTPETKTLQEAAVWNIIKGGQADLVVLARYMQILSTDLAEKLRGRCTNIHH